MSAHDYYMVVVGEMECHWFREGLKWEIRAFGYNRGKEATRWHTYNIMAAIPYCDLDKAGIKKANRFD